MIESKVQTDEPSTQPKPLPLMISMEVQTPIETPKSLIKLKMFPSPEAANASPTNRHRDIFKAARRLEINAIDTNSKQIIPTLPSPVIPVL